jgi:hypothetical protein
LKETKTANGGPECPTLLHYLVKVLLRKDPSLTTFILEMPNIEAASRGVCVIPSKKSVTEIRIVSVQTTLQTVDTIGAGLDRLRQEIAVQKQSRDTQPNDRFVQIMEVMVDRDIRYY